MPARNPKRTSSSTASVRAQLDALRALDADPAGQRELAISYVTHSRNMEVLKPALRVLQDELDPELRPVLHQKYAWCERAPEKNDSGGIVRAAIIRALQPIVNDEDLPLLERALASYQHVGMYEVAAELRAAALNALADLEPELASYHAARFLRDPDNSNSGEPALSAVRLLAAQQQLVPLFGLAAWPGGGAAAPAWLTSSSEVLAEALRNLVDLPASLVPLLIAQYRESEDEQVLLGLHDLLLAHPARSQWRDEIEHFLRHTTKLDLYGIVVTQIVVTRDDELIALLRELAAEERDRTRYELLQHALEHA